MADGTVVISTAIDDGAYRRGMADMERSLSRSLDRMQAETLSAFRSIEQSGSRLFSGLKSAAAGIGLGLGIKETFDLAGAMTNLKARAEIAAGGMAEASEVLDRLRQIADRAYAPLEETANAFMNNSFALNSLGMSIERQLDLTDALTNALVVSGAKGQAFESVMNAISRAMATGRLGGEELEAVMKYGGAAAEALARHLGTTVPGLRALGQEGKITAQVITDALIGSLDSFREMADEMPATFSDSMARLRNQLLATVGRINESTGFEQAAVRGMDFIRDHMDGIAAAIPPVVGGLAMFKLAHTQAFQAVQSATGGLVRNAVAMEQGFAKAREGAGVFDSLKAAVTGFKAEIVGDQSAWDIFKYMFTGENAEIIGRLKAESEGAAQAMKDAWERVRGVQDIIDEISKAQREAAEDTSGSEEALALTERLSQAREGLEEDLAAAREAATAATQRSAAAEAAYMTAAERSAVVQGELAVASARRAQAETQATITQLTAARAAQTANGSETELALTEARLAEQRALLVVQTDALAAAQGRLSAATAAAASRASVTTRALGLLATAGRGALAMLGGPLGIALTGAAVGVMYLTTRESEGERMTRLYGDAVDELARKYNLLAESAEGAGDAVESVTKTQLKASLRQAEDDAKKLREQMEAAFEGMFSNPVKIGEIISGKVGEKRGMFGFPVQNEIQQMKDMGEEYYSGLQGIAEAIRNGDADVMERIQEFDRRFSDFMEASMSKSQYRKWREFMGNLFEPQGKKGNDGRLALRFVAALAQAKEFTEQIERVTEASRRTAESARSALDTALDSEVSFLDTTMTKLRELGVEFESIDFMDFQGQVSSLQNAQKSFRDAMEAQIKAVQDYKVKLEAAMKEEGNSEEDIARAKERLEQMTAFELDLKEKLRDGLIRLEAEFTAEVALKAEERKRGGRLESDEAIEFKEREIKAFLRAEYDKRKAAIEARIEMTAQYRQLLQVAILAFSQMGEAGVAAAARAASAWGQVSSIVADSYTALAQNEANANAAIDSVNLSVGGSGKGGGGGGESAEDKARKTAEALREVELTLARMEGKTVRVAELENAEELQRFNELLAEAGLKGTEAAEALERFNVAQARETRKEGLEAQIEFLEEIADRSPEAAAELAALRGELNGFQAEAYLAAGASRELVDQWLRMANGQEDRTFWGGMAQGVRDYAEAVSAADLAHDFVTDSLDAVSESLEGVVSGTTSASEAFANMANSIIQSLQRMVIEMMVVQPIIAGIQGMLGGFFGGGGGGGGLKNVLNISKHAGGIVGDGGAMRSVSPLVFAGAERFHSGGLVGNEVPIIARSGEMVLTMADQRALLVALRNSQQSQAKTPVTVNVVTNTTKEMETDTKTSQAPGGGLQLDVIIREVDSGLAGRHAKGVSSLSNTMKSSFQLNDALSAYRRG